jgi:hypothetical protein
LRQIIARLIAPRNDGQLAIDLYPFVIPRCEIAHRGMTNAFMISRRISPEVCIFVWPSKIRGRREDRVHAAPAVSRANAHGKSAHEHTGSAETLRPSLRNGFTAYFVLSPVNGFLATVVGGTLPAYLTPAPRRPDHTTSPYA